MNRRCVRCLNLQEESSFKYFQRIKKDMDAKFFCRKCIKKQDMPYVKPKEKQSILKTECVNPVLEFEKLKAKEKLTFKEGQRKGWLFRNYNSLLNKTFDISTCMCEGCQNFRLLKTQRKRGKYNKNYLIIESTNIPELEKSENVQIELNVT